MELNWKWTEIQAKAIPPGRRVVVKIADPTDHVSFGIGMLNGNEWILTAKENEGQGLIVAWMALPD